MVSSTSNQIPPFLPHAHARTRHRSHARLSSSPAGRPQESEQSRVVVRGDRRVLITVVGNGFADVGVWARPTSRTWRVVVRAGKVRGVDTISNCSFLHNGKFVDVLARLSDLGIGGGDSLLVVRQRARRPRARAGGAEVRGPGDAEDAPVALPPSPPPSPRR